MTTGAARCIYALRPADRPGCQLTANVTYGGIALCSACDAQRSTLGAWVSSGDAGPVTFRLPRGLAWAICGLGGVWGRVGPLWSSLGAGRGHRGRARFGAALPLGSGGGGKAGVGPHGEELHEVVAACEQVPLVLGLA